MCSNWQQVPTIHQILDKLSVCESDDDRRVPVTLSLAQPMTCGNVIGTEVHANTLSNVDDKSL